MKTIRSRNYEALRAEQARQDFRNRVQLNASDFVRFDAPRGWVDSLIEDASLTPENTHREISEAAESWARDRGYYVDPDGETDGEES